MQRHPLRSAADRHRDLAQRLYAVLAGAAQRLDCFGLGSLLSAIPDSNEDFVHF